MRHRVAARLIRTRCRHLLHIKSEILSVQTYKNIIALLPPVMRVMVLSLAIMFLSLRCRAVDYKTRPRNLLKYILKTSSIQEA